MKRRTVEKRKIEGISYAFTKDGIELPVLDVTHPLFVSVIDEAKLHEMIKEIGSDAAKRAESFNKIPLFIKRFFAKRSYIMAAMMEMTSGNEYVSGLSTMMMKLGPGLIGKGRKKLFDRLASRAVGSMMIRMRARDMSYFLADSIKKSFQLSPKNDLCIFNIGGGTASDSLNSLIILYKSDPSMLLGKKVEINILDIDDYGPWFACESAKALTSKGSVLFGLDISCRPISYDWKQSGILFNLINNRRDWITVYSSEGGLFEYGEEKHIIENLNIIGKFTGQKLFFSGSVLKDPINIDPIIKETLHMTSIKPKLHGMEGLTRMIADTGWEIGSFSDKNPRYIVFTLLKT